MDGLLKDKFELGGEASIAAGPVGREAAASTNPRMDAGILSYSRSKGAFIGAALKGAVISPDNDLNEAIYGKKADALLQGPPMTFARNGPCSPRSQAVADEILRSVGVLLDAQERPEIEGAVSMDVG